MPFLTVSSPVGAVRFVASFVPQLLSLPTSKGFLAEDFTSACMLCARGLLWGPSNNANDRGEWAENRYGSAEDSPHQEGEG